MANPIASVYVRWVMDNKTKLSLGLMAAAFLAALPTAQAHVGVVNTQLPYAVAGKTYELILAVPHGYELPAAGAAPSVHLDTYKIEVAIPAGFTGVRPIAIDPAFGQPVITKDAAGLVTKLVWTKAATDVSPEDDRSYRIGIRGTLPNAPFTALRFNTKQFFKNPAGGEDLVTDWATYGTPTPSNQSPTVKIFPARAPGWNKFTITDATAKPAATDAIALIAGYFADAQIVWAGKSAWSSNAETLAKVNSLAAQDPSYANIATSTTFALKSGDVIWAKF
jgi:hypothetical protein